jgi:hypothetical protein
MTSVAHARGLLALSDHSATAGDLSLAAERAEAAARELRDIAAHRSPRLVVEDHAHAAIQRVMRPTEHVSKPLARALEQIARKVEGS